MKNLEIIEKRDVLGKEFRIYGDFENPLFLAKDVAEWIDYETSNVSCAFLGLVRVAINVSISKFSTAFVLFSLIDFSKSY